METLTKTTTIPVLRFPEFSEEWENKKVKDLFNISAGGDIKKEHVSEEQTEIFKYPIYANAEKRKGLYGFSDIYKIEGETLTVAGRGVNLGIAHVRTEKFYPIVRLLVLKPKQNLSIFFYEYRLNLIKLFIESTGVPQLTAPQFSNYNIISPSLPEQTKIANFLTAVDDKIGQLSKKKDLLEQYKKGMMQKIFSQEIRFKDDDGNGFEDWEEKKLKDACEKLWIGLVTTMTTHYVEDPNQGVPLIRNSDITQKGIKRSKLIFLDNEFASQHSHRSFQKGDIATVHTGDVGISSVIESQLEGAIGFATLNTRWKTETHNNYYIMYFFNSRKFRNLSIRFSTGDGRQNLNLKDFEKFKIKLPSFSEQTKIANFLSEIDKKIEFASVELEKVKEFKKGLLQQMFV